MLFTHTLTHIDITIHDDGVSTAYQTTHTNASSCKHWIGDRVMTACQPAKNHIGKRCAHQVGKRAVTNRATVVKFLEWVDHSDAVLWFTHLLTKPAFGGFVFLRSEYVVVCDNSELLKGIAL